MRYFRPILLAVAALFVVLTCASGAQAYPWMVRHRYFGCSSCHADPSGGETLSPYGRAQGDLILRMRYGSDSVSAQAGHEESSGDTGGSFDSFDSFDEESKKPAAKAKPPPPAPKAAEEDAGPSKSAGFLWGLWEPPSWLWLGGSYRHALLYQSKLRTFPMQLDVYGEARFGALRVGGSLGGARVPAGSPYARPAQITSNGSNQWNLLSRTHWVGVELASDPELVVRAGRLNLPFGVRTPEHVLWARAMTHTDRESAQQHGLAFALNADWIRGELMGIAGNFQMSPDAYRERGYSGYLEVMPVDGLALGASSLFTIAQADAYTAVQAQTARGAHGAFARARLARSLVLLAEADLLDSGRRDLGYVGFSQLDLELVQGLHLGATGEVLDQGYPDSSKLVGRERSPGAGKPRFGGWGTVDWFFLPHMELRLDAIVRQDADVWYLAQLHAYL